MKIYKHILRKKSVIISFIISYLCILLIPIILAGLVYLRATAIISFEFNRANTAVLKELQQSIDNRLRDVEKLSIQIGSNPLVQGFMHVNKSRVPGNTYDVTQIVKEFGLYNITNSFISDFFVYFKNSDLVLTPNGTYDSKLYYSLYFNNVEMPYEQWIEMISGKKIKTYKNITRNDETGKARNSIVLIQSIPIGTSNDLGTAAIIMDESSFGQAISNLNWINKGKMLILDNSNSILYSSHPLKEAEMMFEYADYGEEGLRVQENQSGEKFVVSYISSDIVSWKYISIFPQQVFMEKINNIRNIATVSLIICIVAGFFLVYYFTRRNYNPINDLIQLLSKKLDITRDGNFNEFHIIQDAIKKTLDEKDKIDEKLKQQNYLMRNNFLVRLLKGNIKDNISIQATSEAYGISFKSNSYAVMVFYIEEVGQLFNNQGDRSVKEPLEMVHFIIKNVVEELVGQSHIGYMMEMDEVMACIVNIPQEKMNNAAMELMNIAQKSIEFINENFKISFFVSISDVYKDFVGIPLAYQQALQGVEYRLLFGEGSIIECCKIKNRMDVNNCSYTMEEEYQFANFMKIGDYKNAKKVLNKIFENNFSAPSLSLQMVKCRLFGLVNTMINTMSEISVVCGNSFMEELNPIERLLKTDNVKELQIQMNGILMEFDQYIQEKKESRETDLIERIMKIVEDHYHDVNFGVSMTANLLDMSVPYLSAFFKKSTGEGLLDYIHKYRIEKAKILLIDSLVVKEIAAKLGYTDSNTFIKTFKKYEGITPGKYKEMKN